MKLNLECGNDIRGGYININLGVVDIKELPDNARFVVGNFRNLDPMIKDDSVEEIIFAPPLNMIGPVESIQVLEHWKKKLQKNGKLVVKFFDARRIGRSLHTGDLSLQDAHYMLFGQRGEFQTLVDTDILRNVAKALNLFVEYITHSEFFVTMTLSKND